MVYYYFSLTINLFFISPLRKIRPLVEMHLAKRLSPGFTLIEMMVVISIIVILILIAVPIHQGSKRELALQGAVHKLAQDLRRAQEMAMSAREFQGRVPRGGYGIHFNLATPTSYILFADAFTPTNHQYDSGEKVEDIPIGGGVKVDFLSPASPLNITFVPPDPTTFVNNSTTTASSVILGINNSTSSVKVLPSGLIFVKYK